MPDETSSLSGLRLAIVGVGALGSEVCRLLAHMGQERVLLIDPDRLDEANLLKSRFYRDARALTGKILGRPKVEVAAEAVRLRNGLNWQLSATEVADIGLGRLAELDLLISCPDSALARVECAYAAHRIQIPMLDGGVQPDGLDDGRASWFGTGPEAACYLCGFSEQRRADMLTFAASKVHPCTSVLEAAAMTGMSGTTRAVAEAMVELMVRNVAERRARSFARRVSAAAGCRETIELTQSPSCPWHSPAGAQEAVTLGADETFRQALDRVDAPETSSLVFLWPICLTATCRECGTNLLANRRVAWVKRRAVCSGCGKMGTLEPQRILTEVKRADDEACLSPEQLGMSRLEWFGVRSAVLMKGPGKGAR